MYCKLCDLQLGDGGGTSNLMNHLQAKHPQEYQKNSESARTKEKQVVLNHNILRVCNSQRAAAIIERVATFLDLQPLRVVEGMGFKQLIRYIEPGYVVPSRTHVASICRKKYGAIKEELLTSLQKIQSVALMSDIWTSRAVQAYLTATIHFITDDWLKSSKVLVTREMTERHTGVHIADSLTEIAKYWNLEEKIVAIVHDIASNMVLTSNPLEDWGDLPCLAHTLQLAVKGHLQWKNDFT